MAKPLVSAIMPTWNGAQTVSAAVESTLNQTYEPLELIVVDDGSSDDTVDQLKPYGDALTLIRRGHSGGCGQARLDAADRARGTYFAFIDQDDLWAPTKIERQVALMEQSPQFPLCHTYMQVIDADGSPMEVRHEGRIPPSGMCAREIIQHCFITISSILIRPAIWRETKQAIGISNANTDIETFLYMLQRFPAGFGFIPEVLGSYRRWPQSMSRQNWKWGPEDVNALDRVYKGRYWEGLLEDREVREIVSDAYWKNAEHWRHAGHPDRSRHFALRGLRYRPTWLPLYGAFLKTCFKRK